MDPLALGMLFVGIPLLLLSVGAVVMGMYVLIRLATRGPARPAPPSTGSVWLVQHEESGRILGVLASSQEAHEFLEEAGQYYPAGVILCCVPVGYRFNRRTGFAVYGPGAP
ncbi:hypothetical protein NY547_07700 [Cnuibacter physcomitrellae]|uniref:hypothetical protein n=1 Tax=Cnuibacter physcomitrellae TaxID=1619308 RepID=UPI0021758530|nr:hypothetical protein [Cnuibacter physcomitrellae]MCS5497116.1 hypothetical protein [Cnuibacter physcomitrellae]